MSLVEEFAIAEEAVIVAEDVATTSFVKGFIMVPELSLIGLIFKLQRNFIHHHLPLHRQTQYL